MSMTLCPSGNLIEIPCIHQVGWRRPFVWLRHGLSDCFKSWPASLTYGVIFAVAGYLLVNQGWAEPHLALVLTSGFLLVGAFLALGFYELSRRIEFRLEHPGAPQPGFGWSGNLASIGLFGFFLAFMLSVWERLSAIMIGLYLSSSGVADASFTWLFTLEHPQLVVMYVGVGALFALAIYALSATALPMMLDRPVDIVTAMVSSLWTVWQNRAAMLVWAVLIVALTALGIASSFVGLALIFPVLGHATWHAYRDLIVR